MAPAHVVLYYHIANGLTNIRSHSIVLNRCLGVYMNSRLRIAESPPTHKLLIYATVLILLLQYLSLRGSFTTVQPQGYSSIVKLH